MKNYTAEVGNLLLAKKLWSKVMGVKKAVTTPRNLVWGQATTTDSILQHSRLKNHSWQIAEKQFDYCAVSSRKCVIEQNRPITDLIGGAIFKPLIKL